jgi:AbrB family looped-hinge helix DNA binding protein
MQVRISEDGHLAIPAQIREQLGIEPGTWLEIEISHGTLQVSVVPSKQADQEMAQLPQPHSRLATLKPHPEAVPGSDDDLDRVTAWDEAEWAREWDL